MAPGESNPEAKATASNTSALDDMNRMLILTRGGAWVGLLALLAIMLAALLAIFWIKVPQNITLEGYASAGVITCYVDIDHVDDLRVGQEALIDREIVGRVQSISGMAFSSAEAKDQIQDAYARHLLDIPEWSARVDLSYDGELAMETVHLVVVTTTKIALSSLLVGAGS